MTRCLAWLAAVWLMSPTPTAQGQADPQTEAETETGTETETETETGTGTETETETGTGTETEAVLPAEHLPRLRTTLSPDQLVTGELLRVNIVADAVEGDDVTVAEQSFGPFEVSDKRVRIEPAREGRQRFIFEIDLLALEAGTHTLAPIQLRVVTSDGFVGATETKPRTVEVGSLLANEPNAEPKGATEPVTVLEDDYTLLYLVGGVFGAALIALITWLTSRWWSRREKKLPPPPPPRPPWEIAVEKLAALRQRKQRMLEEGKGVQFVDEVSDVVREYLGGRFGFDGLESTTDEMLAALKSHNAHEGLREEVRAYLNRCDLIKFAKVTPDQDEIDLIFAKAQDIVQFSTPEGQVARPESPVAEEVRP